MRPNFNWFQISLHRFRSPHEENCGREYGEEAKTENRAIQNTESTGGSEKR